VGQSSARNASRTATSSAPQHSERRTVGPDSLQPRGRTVDTVRTEAARCALIGFHSDPDMETSSHHTTYVKKSMNGVWKLESKDCSKLQPPTY
jgi:hypothetical protein